MEKYSVTFKKSVAKDFRAIPKSDVKKILAKIDLLAENTRGGFAIMPHVSAPVIEKLYAFQEAHQ